MTSLYENPLSESSRIKQLEEQIDKISDELIELRDKNQDYVTENIRLNNRIKDLENANELLRQTIANDPNQQKINELVTKLTLDLEKSEQEKLSLKKQLEMKTSITQIQYVPRDQSKTQILEFQAKLNQSQKAQEALKNENEELKSLLKNHQNTINELERNVSTQKNANKEAVLENSRKISSMNSINNKQKAKIDGLTTENQRLENENSELQAVLQNKDNEINRYKKAADDNKRIIIENKQLKETIALSQQTANKYQTKLRVQQYSMTSLEGIYQKKIQEKDQIIEQQMRLIEELKDKNKEAHTRNLSQSVMISHENAKKQNEMKLAEKQINNLNEMVNKLKEENAALAKKANKASAVQDEKEALETRNKELEQEKETLKNQACHEISVLQATCDVTKAKLSDSEKAMKRQIEDLETKLIDAYDQQSKTLERIDAERKSIIASRSLEQSKQNAQVISKLKEEIETQEVAINQLKSTIAEQNVTISNLTNTLKETQSQISIASPKEQLSPTKSYSSNASTQSDSPNTKAIAELTRKKLKAALKTMEINAESDASVPQLTDSLITALQSPVQKKRKRVVRKVSKKHE